MVRLTHEIGIKPTSGFFRCFKNVFKKWYKYGLKGLKDLSRRPKHSSKRINYLRLMIVFKMPRRKNISLLIMLEDLLK